jgi:hypothetical protein
MAITDEAPLQTCPNASPQGRWTTHLIPFHFTFSCIGGDLGRPKEGMLDFVHQFEARRGVRYYVAWVVMTEFVWVVRLAMVTHFPL